MDSLNVVSVDECSKCVVENRDLIVGIKVRLSDSIADDGKNEHEAYRQVSNLRPGFLFVFIYSQFEKYMFNSTCILKTV